MQILQCLVKVGEIAVSASGDVVTRQEVFGEGFGTFKLGGALGGAKAF